MYIMKKLHSDNVLFECSILLLIIGKSFSECLLQNVQLTNKKKESLECIFATHPYPKKLRIETLAKAGSLGEEQVKDALKKIRTKLSQEKRDVTQPTCESNLLYTCFTNKFVRS